MKVAILGAGNGGVSAAVDLTLRGFKIALWNRTASTLNPYQSRRSIAYEGVFGEGHIKIDLITTDLGKCLDFADVAMICLPTHALGQVAEQIVLCDRDIPPIILNPGHTGGALEFSATFKGFNHAVPDVAEFSTLTYVARKTSPGKVNISGAANHVWLAAMPKGRQAVNAAKELYPFAKIITNVIGTGLANVNMVLHPPGAILGAAWSEATQGDYTFYVEGLTPGVGRVMEGLDEERLAVARAYGHELPDLFHEMKMIGTIEQSADEANGLLYAVRSGQANRLIKAPDSLEHRYYREDFWYGLKPFLAIADIADVQVPIAQSLMRLAEAMLPHLDHHFGRTTEKMGIDQLTKNELINRLNE